MTDRIERTDVCSLGVARRVASMLDLDPDEIQAGQPLPRGWQFCLLGGDTRRSLLRADGFPGFGVPMPDLGLPRLLIAGRTVEYLAEIIIGSEVRRTSFVENIRHRTSDSGPMAIVTLRHELRGTISDTPAIVETQTFVLMSAIPAPAATATRTIAAEPPLQHCKSVTPDDTLLFQYSALGFNSHKIHLDRAYARNVEGLPDLVVNGGLTTLFLTEFLRTEIGATPRTLKVKYTAPLYSNRPVKLSADPSNGGWRLKAIDDRGVVAVEMEVAAT